MTFPEPRAAYIHVPFCVHRCGYCDFTLVAGRDDLMGDYLNALGLEMQSLARPREIDTLFFGGGTPTQLAADQLRQLFEIVAQWFRLAPNAEVSVEANPDGLDEEKLIVMHEAGVNRVSLGIQSFDPVVLSTLERQHSPEDIHAAIGRVRKHIDNISLDLIFGVPDQSLQSWETTLEETIACKPQHVSTYGLTYEKGTTFWSRRERGELVDTHPEIERSMYQYAMERLPAAGIPQYELSNFARDGYPCRHNETYWAAAPYFAFGPGAARYAGGRRETNHRSVFTWLKRLRSGQSAIAEVEEMTSSNRAHEAIMLGFRRTAGIDRKEFAEQFGCSFDELVPDALSRHIELGNLEDDGQRIRLTQQGRFIADSVVVDFL